MEAKLRECLASVRERTDFEPQVAVVLGSGLGDFVRAVDVVTTIPYAEVRGLPVCTVEGHAGRLVLGFVAGVPAVVLQGRIHYYEGHAMADVVRPVRLAGLLGAKALILTNAAGAIRDRLAPGDLMMIDDHISSLVPSPLVGPHAEELGERFPDMSGVYDAELRAIAREVADEAGIALREGTYVQVSGPNYETPAEVRMLRGWGADAVGMSTAVEAMAAHAMGLRVFGVSCITNLAAGITSEPLSHAEVQRIAATAADSLERLLSALVARIGESLAAPRSRVSDVL